MLRKGFVGILLVVCFLAIATLPALASTPEFYDFEYSEDPYILADCHDYGYDFEITDYAEGSGFGKIFFNQDGSINRVQEHLSGIDVMTNSNTGKQIYGNWTVNDEYFFGEEDGYIYRHGLPFHVTYPGLGNIVLDGGFLIVHYWFENGDIYYEVERANGHFTYFYGDFEAVCAAMAE